MKVLFCPTHYILDSHREGSEFAWAYNIVNRLSLACEGSVVVTGRSDLTEDKAYRILELTPDTRGFNASNLAALRFNLLYTAATFRALRSGSFELVHHVLPFAIDRTFNLAAALPQRRTPFVIGPVQPPLSIPDLDVDPRDVHGGKAPRRRWLGDVAAAPAIPLLALVSRLTLQRGDRIVAVNATARDLLLSRGVPSDRIAIIPPGVDCERFTERNAADRSLDSMRLLVVCHLVKRKNVALVLRAFAEARRAGVEAQLMVIGDGPESSSLRAASRNLGVERNVEFAGFVPHAQIHDHYRRAHVFLNASRSEGFSTTALEAMAAGLPIISTNVGGFGDAIRDGGTGYLVPQDDEYAMAARIRQLARDPRLLLALSERARATAAQRFDWGRAIIPRYLDVYRGLVKPPVRVGDLCR